MFGVQTWPVNGYHFVFELELKAFEERLRYASRG